MKDLGDLGAETHWPVCSSKIASVYSIGVQAVGDPAIAALTACPAGR